MLSCRFKIQRALSALQAVQNIVSATEKALKLVSDAIAEEDSPKEDAAGKARGLEDVIFAVSLLAFISR